MNKPSPKTERDFSKDLKTFEELPAQTKELSVLQDQADKTIGREGVAVDKTIQSKTQKRNSHPAQTPK